MTWDSGAWTRPRRAVKRSPERPASATAAAPGARAEPGVSRPAAAAAPHHLSRERVITSAVLGVAVISLLVWVPIVGALVLGVLWLVGLGAVMTTVGSRWRGRRRSRRMAASVPPPSGAGGPAAPPGPTWPEPSEVPGS